MSDTGNRDAGRSSAASYAKAQLVCREVREDLVALHRNELSPLRAESVGAHLVSCPECREESLELDLAMRSFQKLPELETPRGLVDASMKRVIAAHGWVEDSGRGKPAVPGAPVGNGEAFEPARAGPPEGVSVWFRPVRQSLAWAAVAAVLLLTIVAGFVEPFNDAVGRVQRTILGRRISRVLDRATDAFLTKLRL
jgi:anti-sigma factor RsiW